MPMPHRDAPAARRPLADVLYDRLRDAIVAGELRPDDTVSDAAIAEWSGMSRTPAREALDRLAFRGLVVVQPRRPTRIAPLDEDRHRQTLEALGCVLPAAAAGADEPITCDLSSGSVLFAPEGLFEQLVRADGGSVLAALWEDLSAHVRRHWKLVPESDPTGIDLDAWEAGIRDGTASEVTAAWFSRVTDEVC